MITKITKLLDELDVNSIAFKTGFCRRAPRKITPANFILSFCLCFRNSQFSLRNWSFHLSNLINDSVSFQAIDKKLQYNKVDFVKELFKKACTIQFTYFKRQQKTKLFEFNRILIQDSTLVKLPDSHYNYSSGVSNGKTKKALARLQICFDLCKGNIIQSDLCSYSENDRAYSSKLLLVLQAGDLVIRDLGYFCIPVFRAIQQVQAFFLSKYHKGVGLYDNQGVRMDFVKYLKSLDKNSITSFDMNVKMGSKEKFPVRVCGYRVSQQQAMKKRNQMKSSRHKSDRISERAIYLCNWNIYVTNVSEELQVNDIFETYRLRWSIETMFKHWKGNLQLNQLAYSCKTPNPARPEMLIYLMLLYTVLAFRPIYNEVAQVIKNKFNRYLSPKKFSNFLKTNIEHEIDTKSTFFINLILRNCCYDKRSDRSNFFQLYDKLIFLG